SAPARIINISSNTHATGRIFFDDVNLTRNYRPWRAYEQSKLANIMFTYSLSERLAGTGVTVNCLHPGAVATNIGVSRNANFVKTIRRIIKPFFLTAEKGAETVIYLAASPEVERITGKYFVRKHMVPSSKLSYDEETAKRLWDLSEQMTRISNNQTK
ncbi:MAG: SDR family NAD(P)-dependent oxidoreductase, partial [Bacillota bacterium]